MEKKNQACDNFTSLLCVSYQIQKISSIFISSADLVFTY